MNFHATIGIRFLIQISKLYDTKACIIQQKGLNIRGSERCLFMDAAMTVSVCNK